MLQEFETRYLPVSNVIYKHYVLNKRAQEACKSLDHYITEVMKHAELCKYDNLEDKLVHDRLVSGTKDERNYLVRKT